jgi:hypothetical protein
VWDVNCLSYDAQPLPHPGSADMHRSKEERKAVKCLLEYRATWSVVLCFNQETNKMPSLRYVHMKIKD